LHLAVDMAILDTDKGGYITQIGWNFLCAAYKLLCDPNLRELAHQTDYFEFLFNRPDGKRI
jgi:hypothetical protein